MGTPGVSRKCPGGPGPSISTVRPMARLGDVGSDQEEDFG
jgi:hypothetical protein